MSNLTNNQGVQNSESKFKDIKVNGSSYDASPEKTNLLCDEYTILLKKHLNVVEDELSRLKGPQR